jgi:polyisoprenyl-teichoic acid--peptidoglycan teichoic acid transferase
MPPSDKSDFDNEDPRDYRGNDDYSDDFDKEEETGYKPRRGIPDDSREEYRKEEYQKDDYEDGRYEKEHKNDRFEQDFFTDKDFDMQDFEEEDYKGQEFRSSKIKSRRKKRKMIFSSIGIMIILAIIAVGIVFGYRFIKNKYFPGTNESTTVSEESIVIPGDIKLGKDVSIVISCAGDNLLEPELNTIIFSKYTAGEKKLVSLCIPVNTLFEIPGFGQNNVSEAVGFGGMDLLKLTLKNNIGMDVENYILLDVAGVVNKLESIKLNLDKEITITGQDGSSVKLKQGENIVNGETAYSFLSYFSGKNKDANIEDVTMQKLLVDSIFKKIVGTKDGDISKNLSSISKFIDTDLSLEELSEVISTVAYLDSDSNKAYALEGRVESIDENTIVYIPNISKVGDLFGMEPETTEETTAENTTGETYGLIVLNGTGTSGIAGKASDILKAMTYPDGKPRYEAETPADADNYNYDKTKIVIKSEDENLMQAADFIASVLLVGDIEVSEDGSQKEDIEVIIGKDFDYEKAAANAEKIKSQSQSTEENQEGTTSETTGETSSIDTSSVQGHLYDVIILNGEGTQGIATTAKDIIEKSVNKTSKIVQIEETKNADSFNYNVTKILINKDKDGIDALAKMIQGALGVGTISNSSENPDDVDITIILGSDFTK